MIEEQITHTPNATLTSEKENLATAGAHFSPTGFSTLFLAR